MNEKISNGMKLKKILPFVIVAIFLTLFCFLIMRYRKILVEIPKGEQSFIVKETKFVKIGGQMIKVELATTEETQKRGLSGRTMMKDGEGMLFIFSKPGKYFFWMKEMNFPIDMIWLAPSDVGIDKNFKVIYIKKDADPSSYPESFGPDVDNQYVLEVSADFSEKNNLKEGDRVEFLR